jgi:hypothetical protein
MINLGPLEIVVLVVALALEVGLIWAAAALGDAPEVGWPKLIGLALGAGLLCLGGTLLVCWSLGILSESAEVAWLRWVLAGALAVLLFMVIPTLLYTPLFPVSLGRGLFISVVQLLLRVFLYVLVAGVVFVALAIFQISTHRA